MKSKYQLTIISGSGILTLVSMISVLLALLRSTYPSITQIQKLLISES